MEYRKCSYQIVGLYGQKQIITFSTLLEDTFCQWVPQLFQRFSSGYKRMDSFQEKSISPLVYYLQKQEAKNNKKNCTYSK